MKVQVVAVCKTVGQPAMFEPITCHTLGKRPLAGFSWLAGCFVSVPGRAALYRRVPLYPGIHGRMADGIRAAETVGVTVGLPRTATDGPCRRDVPA